MKFKINVIDLSDWLSCFQLIIYWVALMVILIKAGHIYIALIPFGIMGLNVLLTLNELKDEGTE